MTKEEKAAYDRERYLANREYKLAQNNTWNAANKESLKAKGKIYRDNNKETRKVYDKVYNDTVRHPYRRIVTCPDGFVVHHLNHNPDDNRRTNLLVMLKSDHMSYHAHIRYGNYSEASEIIKSYEIVV
jgi:hypothetical protein